MKKCLHSLLGSLLLLVALSACAQTEDHRWREIKDLAYLISNEVVVDSLQRLNLVIPEEVDHPPLLLWIGGGAWSFVDRHQEMDLARQFARKGIAVASVGHQLSKGTYANAGRTTGVKHPAHIKDVAAAFKWLYEHGEEYGYDQQNIFVGGFSSGAHLAALLGTDKRYLAELDMELDQIRGLLPIAGAYDIVDYYNAFLNSDDPNNRPLAETHVKDVFGDTQQDFINASPSTYLDNLKAPMLLVSEGALYNYTQVFEEQLRATDYTDYQILHVFDFDHGGLWKDLSFAGNSFARKVMIDFIYHHRQVKEG